MDVNLIPGIEIYSNLNYKNGDFVFTSTSGEMDRYLHLADPMEFPNLPLRNLLLSYCKGCRMVERMQNHYRIELSKVSRAKLDQAKIFRQWYVLLKVLKSTNTIQLSSGALSH